MERKCFVAFTLRYWELSFGVGRGLSCARPDMQEDNQAAVRQSRSPLHTVVFRLRQSTVASLVHVYAA